MNKICASAVSPAQCWARALGNLANLHNGAWPSFPAFIDDLAERFATNVALASPRETLTYRDLAHAKNAYAAWAASQHTAQSRPVCVLAENAPRYLALWLGILQAGGTASLINTNLRGDALIHALTCAGASSVVADPAMLPHVEAVRERLPPDFAIWQHGAANPATTMARNLDPAAYTDDAIGHAPPPNATALLIFTSGTTGLPKAARISHYRLLEWSLWFAGMMAATADDILFNCLPMYHSTGGVAAIGGVLANGGAVVLRERFSRQNFWRDIATSRSTIFLYIGELCRYLANAPPTPDERRHNLRLCCGNGLREDVWHIFKQRFAIPRILEFYASTEGNVSLYNCEEKPGAIGRVPGYLKHRFPTELIVCAAESGEPLRGPDGFCIKCADGAAGEAIGKISAAASPGPGSFDGYTDSAASDRKILRNAFEPGDAWYRTGDLMRRDAAGFYYFIDRMGDNFRCKGENVSTTEVAGILAACPGVAEALVYGVAIDGEEGRACMAALTTNASFDWDSFKAFTERNLPPYARPRFVRLCQAHATTGTFKPVKTHLVEHGYDPQKVRDPLFAYDNGMQAYRSLSS